MVVLGDYYKTEFPTTGARTAATQFNIVLKNCPVTVTNAKVRFDGTPDATNSSLLAIDSSAAGAATGVAINLMSADKADLPLHGSNSYSYVLSSTADNNLSFYAQYISPQRLSPPVRRILSLTSPWFTTNRLQHVQGPSRPLCGMRFTMRFINTTGLAVALSALTLSTAQAGVIIGGTRIIFDGTKRGVNKH